MTLNKAMIIGNVGKDPEVKHLDKGLAVVTLPIATTERFKDKNGELREQTEWHNVVFWRSLAEFVERHVRKGSQVFVEGKLRTRSWEDQNGQKKYATEIVADVIRLLGKRSDNDSNHNNGGSYSQQDTKPAAGISDSVDDIDDDLPF